MIADLWWSELGYELVSKRYWSDWSERKYCQQYNLKKDGMVVQDQVTKTYDRRQGFEGRVVEWDWFIARLELFFPELADVEDGGDEIGKRGLFVEEESIFVSEESLASHLFALLGSHGRRDVHRLWLWFGVDVVLVR
jgi:hypothetical protein